MKSRLCCLCTLLVTLTLGVSSPTAAQEKKPPELEKVVEGAKVYEGLFKLYHKDNNLWMEILPNQLDQPFLCPIAIAKGMGMGGHTLNFGDQWVLLFKKAGENVHLVRRNVRFRASKNKTVARAVETTYMDSVLMSLPVRGANPGRRSLLVSLNDIFMTDFAELRRGRFDASRSVWHKIKAFPRNIELEVAATYVGGLNGDSVIDSRGTTVVIHYGLCQLPDSGYQPRLADDRVGHFLSVVKDFSNDNHDTPFVRYVNRWRVEPAFPPDPKNPGKLAPPKKKIVFWIENTVPEEYRSYVRDGILEWNKAFEKIGFENVIEVRQQESEDFDPEDINYNTFRWVANDEGYAMGPSRANPLTGEIMDADIIFDASMVRFYRDQAKLYSSSGAEIVSPIEAARRGLGIQDINLPRGELPDETPEGWNDRAKLFKAIQQGFCQCGPSMKRELHLASLALLARGPLDADGKPSPAAVEEVIGQVIKEVTMHEVGHTLGLRHNFKASAFHKNEDLHNTELTRKVGLTASVMDYAPINLAPKGTKQGDYFSTTLGPYDYWAIEYAYKPLQGGTDGEWEKLQEIAAKCATPGLSYGTDEDLFTTSDPLINMWDLGSDPMKFAQDRIGLAEDLLKTLAEKASGKGESYVHTRNAFSVLLQEYGNAAYLISSMVGGVYVNRDHRGDPGGREPLVPVAGDKQREALKYLQEHILSERAFQFPPALLRRLGADRWLHWGNDRMMFGQTEYPVHERILGIQRSVLNHTLSSSVLSRVQNNALRANGDDNPLTVAEVFRSLTDGIWNDSPRGEKDAKRTLHSSAIRRNLQREHLAQLSAIVLASTGRNYPADARSLARMHLREVAGRIDKLLSDKDMSLDDTTRAHLEESRERITKVLGASMQVREP